MFLFARARQTAGFYTGGIHTMGNFADQRLAALRSAMQNAGISAYLIPSTDPHGSEFLPAHYAACSWFSGFTGEGAALALTLSDAALWVDGRFFEQGEKQLSGTGIQLMRTGEPNVPSVENWLSAQLRSGGILGFDGHCVSASLAEKLQQALKPNGAAVQSIDLITPVWAEARPSEPSSECWLLTPESAGADITQKLADARRLLADAQADALAESRLDCIAWLLNLRAMDIECTPYALAFCLLSADECRLYIHTGRVSAAVRRTLEQCGVRLYNYTDFYKDCSLLSGMTVLYDPSAANYDLCRCLTGNSAITAVSAVDPLLAPKGIRNAGELSSTRQAHLQDGAAMVRFQIELERRMAGGESITEIDIDAILHRLRSAQPGFIVESFPTIAAWGANASIIHYHAEPGHCSFLEPHGLLLVDSGATYHTGTTDITRTYALGPLTAQERQSCTWVLQCHIELARAVWPDRCTGGDLDMLARQPLWQHKLDFRHGTGHGVAHVGNVHEGPQSIRPQNPTILKPGMVITDEPGLYEPGLLGVRIENELEVVEAGQSSYGRWLRFEPLTWVPYDLRTIDLNLLTNDQIDWLNEYHAQVRTRLAPLLRGDENRWLEEKTKPVPYNL